MRRRGLEGPNIRRSVHYFRYAADIIFWGESRPCPRHRFGETELQFDNRTATKFGALAAFGVSVLSGLLWRTRRTYPGFGRWMLGNSATCLAWLRSPSQLIAGLV